MITYEVQKRRLINEICDMLAESGVPPASVAEVKNIILENLDEYDLIKILVRHHRRQLRRMTYQQLADRYNITLRQAKYICSDKKKQ